jgi:Tol biopolymer transport system component
MRFDRLDKAALLFAGGLALIAVLLIARGDQVGVQITHVAPANSDKVVSTRAQLAFTFSEPMSPTVMDGRLTITPPLSGTLRWNGTTAFFVPSRLLQYDTLYTVTIASGGQSLRGRILLHPYVWTFQTGHPRVTYLSPASGAGDLYVHELSPGAAPRRLTQEPQGVYDYAVSADGSRIAYSTTRPSGARDLWLINADGTGRQQLVACDQQVCQSPTWSADGTRIAFERRNLVQGTLGNVPGPARIWLYDLTNHSIAPLMSDSQQLGNIPRFAPSGNRLAFYDPTAGMVTVYDVVSQERVQFPSVLGDPGTWSPDGQQLIYPELQAADEGQFTQLLRADLASGVITSVMPLSTSNDASVTWSPAGLQIAFTRQRMGASGTSGGALPFGPQVWASTPLGSGPRALTDQNEYSFGGLAYSPDGTWIVAVRNNLQMPNPKPEVWLIRSDGSQQYRLATDATIPAWLP